jgi:RNA polymerase sigma factor (sigma-70 family)
MSTSLPAAAGSADAHADAVDLGAVYRAARSRLIRLAVLLVDDLPTAEDLVQDVFTRLQRRSYAPVASVDAYLTAAVLNAARSTLRRRRVAAAGLLRLGARHGVGVDPAEMSVEQHHLWQAINRLPVRQRQVVVCRYYLDLSEHDTARTLGVSAGTVKTSTARAMKTLALALEDNDD